MYMDNTHSLMSRLRPRGVRRLDLTRFLWPGARLPSRALLGTVLWLVRVLGNLSAAAALPSGWTDIDIGSPGVAGSASYSAPTWTASGGGADIWNNADQFNFLYRNTTDNEIVAQVNTITDTDPWAKAGVMIRDNTTAGAMFADAVITPANGVAFQWRNSTGGACGNEQVTAEFVPIWVKLVNASGVFSAYYSNDGTTWTLIGSPQSIPMVSSSPLPGLCVTAHNNSDLCTATFANVTLSYLAPPPPPTFGVYRQLWTNLNSAVGNTLDALTNTAYNPNWPNNPDPAFTKIYTNFETDVNTGMNYYGQRLRAFVVPPTNGDYVFWISSDDTSELFVSTDETPQNKVPNCWVTSWTDSRDWYEEPNQQGPPVFLQAGQRYYVEAIMQQGTGGDNLAVRWQLPNGTFEEPLPASSVAGTHMVPYTGVDSMPGIYQQTTNVTVVEGLNALFSVLSTNQSSLTYKWSTNGIALTGPAAQQPSYSITNVALVASGQVYRCTLSNSVGVITSSPMTLIVFRDTYPPTVLRALNVGTTSVEVVYSKAIEPASGTNTANYVFTNGLNISAAFLAADNVTVTLATAPLVYGSNYTLVINGVRDHASMPNTIATNTTVTFMALPYASQDIGGPPIPAVITFVSNNITVTASGSDIGGLSDQFNLNYQPITGNFDIALCLAGLSGADVWTKAGLMARETLDPGSRFAAALATPTMAGSFFEWRDPANSQANLTGYFPPNFPNAWLRLQRSGNTFTGFASYDGLVWNQLGSAVLTFPSQIYVGLAVCSHNSSEAATAQFIDLLTVTNAVVGQVANPHEPLGPCSRLTPIIISEIMYTPAPRADTNNLEYIELYNSNPFFEDISGFQLVADNLSCTFPPGTILGGGAFLVAAASPGSMANVYGITNVVGPYVGSLKKSGTINLLDDQGAVLLTVPYSDTYPWPVAAHATGHSIVLANPTYGEGDPRAWDISDIVGGSPGGPEAYRPSPLRNVVINELLAHSENSAVLQFVELYNHSSQTNDLSGCILTDDPSTNKFVIPAATLIGPAGFVSFSQTQLGFTLDGSGEKLYFIKPDGSRVLDAVQFEAQADGMSWGRWPDGAADFYPMAARTPGTNNSGIWIGDIVINELMYDPISGNDDDQYIELYNKETNTISLANWQFTVGVSFTFPANISLAPGGYLVVARNQTNLFAKYPNLNAANTVGNYGGTLSHKGERLALAMPQFLTSTGSGGPVTNTIYVVEDEVTYGVGGRWGQWAKGGGSSLELINPNTNHRLAYNWTDSNDTSKSVWTNLEFTGILDNGSTYNGNPINLVQVGLLDVGECLVDDLEVRPGGTNGANIVSGGDFESGLTGWSPQGDHMRSSLETAAGLGGYQSSQSLHLRSSDSMWTLGDYVQGSLTQTNLASGQTATLRLKARWLHGWPEVLMRLNGNFIEVTGAMPVPPNLGTPGMPNSRYIAQPGPAIYEVKHTPSLPPANVPVVVTARFHDFNTFQPTLLYRIDTAVNPTPTYTSVPMTDDGTGGDALAGDGIYSATIPAQPAGTVVAFLVQARDVLSGAANILPSNLNDNAGLPRECVVAFGDPIPTGSYSHHHVFITQNWAQLWATWGGVSHESYDGTWVDGGGRIVYDWKGRYAGSPYHQYLGSPVGTIGGMHWDMPDDDQVFGTASFDKQHVPGNGALDDDTLQREQASFWMAHKIGLPRQNRRFYVYYVNGTRHGPLMEDAQVPGTDMIKEYWPNDNNGWLYKNHGWFEGDVVEQSDGYMNFNMPSWCTLGAYTTTINGVPNQYKLARYRWMWLAKQYPASANDYGQVFALIDAANTPTTSPAYYARMEAQVDTEEWLRMSAMEHATGDWDSFFTQNQWNMYCYKPTMGKWTALKWDWNITLGSGTQTWPPDGSQLFNVGANDPVMGTFQTYVPYLRAYLRALQDIANLAMNNAVVNPVLDAKYASFEANGLTENSAYGLLVQDPAKPGGLEDWIATMHNSLLVALTNQGVSSVAFAVNSTVISNDTAIVTGTAPIAVKTIWFNGMEYPVTWSTVTDWVVTVPLQPGSNQFSLVGVDIYNRPVTGATATISPVYNGTVSSPVGQVVINEIMYDPVVPGAEFVELYNNSTNTTFDLSGWLFNGLGYTFPAGSLISPSSYLILTADPTAFAEAYGGTVVAFDTFPGALPNSQEMLSLIKPGSNGSSNLTVAAVQYDCVPPWPTPISGSSLQLIDPRQDNWRVGNWAIVSSNGGYAPAQWVFVTTNVPATSSRLYIYLGSAGDVYVDDVSLVGSAGTNLVKNGGFESPLSGAWNLTANFTNSALSTTIKHSGSSSLHVVATAAGTGSGNAIYQDITPALTNGTTYTISFWYLQSTNGGPLTVRLSSSSNPATVNIAPPLLSSLALATPDAINSPSATLAAFPPLWLNELQADNLTGITNSAGQRTAWLELYNPSTNLISLDGLYLANDYTNLTQWAFPTNATINPGQFKVIFADGQTNLSTTNELHASFVLPSTTGSLVLTRLTSNAQLQVLDYINYANLATNYSFGSFPDGQSFVRQAFYHATPGDTNDGTTMPPPSFIPYTTAGAVYTQNFDSLPDPGADSVNSGNPVTINGITYSLANPFDFAFPVIASGNVGGLGIPALAGWYGMADPTASVGTRFGATDGDQTTGGIISFGLPNSSNRAVGLLATSTTGYTGFGAKFINQTPDTLNSITLQLTGEVWRQSDKPKTLQFYYFIDPTATTPFSTSYTAFLPALNVSFPTVPSDVGGVAVDGTAPANQISLGVTNQVITNWPPGAALWLVWEMADATGKAQGLGIDNLSFSANQLQSTTNTPPTLAAIPNQTVYANTLLTFTATATDTDQPPQTLTFSLGAGSPTGASITSGGVFTWTPTAAQAPSTNTISVIVTDSGVPPMSATNSFIVMVYRPNTPPALSSIPNQTVYANTLLTFTATATDTDQPPQTLTFSLGPGAPTGASITSGGVFTWTPTAAQGPSTNTISVIVTDSGVPPISVTNSFKVVVFLPNTPPVIAAISNQTVYANRLLSFAVSATDTDQPPQTLTFSLGAGAPTGASITIGGVFTWTPTAAQAPTTNTISVIVTDSGVPPMSATNSFSVVVYRPNTPPVLSAIPNQTIYANSLLTFTVSATDTDQPPQILTFSLGTGAPTGASITTNGVFSWTPTAAQAPSTNTLSVIVTDSGVPQMSATNSFSVVVYPPNTPPVLAAIPNQTVYANTLLTFTASATDTDQPRQTLTFTLGTGVPSGASITPGGLFTWTPTDAQAPSTNLITVTVTDNGVPPLSDTNTFDVIVVAAIKITSVTRSGNSIIMTWNSQAGQTYRVSYKNTLTETLWQQLGPDILAGGPTTSATDTIQSGLAVFYRVELVK